jgi:hypothetical protein
MSTLGVSTVATERDTNCATLGLSMLAALGGAGVRRVQEGGELDEKDIESLYALAGIFEAGAREIDTFSQTDVHPLSLEGTYGAYVNCVIELVICDSSGRSAAAPELARTLRKWAITTKDFVARPRGTDSDALLTFLNKLWSFALC